MDSSKTPEGPFSISVLDSKDQTDEETRHASSSSMSPLPPLSTDVPDDPLESSSSLLKTVVVVTALLALTGGGITAFVLDPCHPATNYYYLAVPIYAKIWAAWHKTQHPYVGGLLAITTIGMIAYTIFMVLWEVLSPSNCVLLGSIISFVSQPAFWATVLGISAMFTLFVVYLQWRRQVLCEQEQISANEVVQN